MKKKIKNNVAGVNGTFVSVVTGSSAALPCDIRPPSPRFLKMNTIFMIYIQGVSKKTEFCRIEHLQILLAVGEKYL